MKRIMIMLFSVWMLSSSDLFAVYLHLEGEDDIERVSNNVIYFYSQNYDDLIFMEEKAFKAKECQEQLTHIKNTDLFSDYMKNKKSFKKDFLNLTQFISKNEPLISNKIGEPNYQYFINGIFYIHHLLNMQ